MNKKKVGAVLSALALSTTLAFADTNQTSTTKETKTTTVSTTNTQKEKVKSETKTKWDNLTDAQRNEVYKIQEEIVKLEKQKVDKLYSLGLLTKEEADDKKTALDEQLTQMKANKSLPKTGGKKGDKAKGDGTAKTKDTTNTTGKTKDTTKSTTTNNNK